MFVCYVALVSLASTCLIIVYCYEIGRFGKKRDVTERDVCAYCENLSKKEGNDLIAAGEVFLILIFNNTVQFTNKRNKLNITFYQCLLVDKLSSLQRERESLGRFLIVIIFNDSYGGVLIFF